jgi:hypothetical protein
MINWLLLRSVGGNRTVRRREAHDDGSRYIVPSPANDAAAIDSWIAEEQWLAGFPSNAGSCLPWWLLGR